MKCSSTIVPGVYAGEIEPGVYHGNVAAPKVFDVPEEPEDETNSGAPAESA